MLSSHQQFRIHTFRESANQFSHKDMPDHSTTEQSLSESPHHTQIDTFPAIQESPTCQFSIHSFKKNQDKPQYSTFQSSEQQSQKFYQEEKRNYYFTQRILKRQNENLKEQNQFLLKQVYKWKSSNKKVKELYRLKKLEIEEIQEQCNAHKKRGDDIMNIIKNRLQALEQKVKHKNIELSSCSLLDIVNSLEVQE